MTRSGKLLLALSCGALVACHRGSDARDDGGGTATDGGTEGDDDGAGTDAGDDDGADDGATDPEATPSTATRRLSAYELTRTLEVLTGVVPDGLDRLPPESTGFVFQRVVDGQTVSRPHLEAYMAIAESVAVKLLSEKRLDDLSAACPDEILPPSSPSTMVSVHGSSLTGAPEWAFSTSASDPTVLSSVYAPDPVVSYAQTFPAPGTYEIALTIDANNTVDTVEIWFDGTLAAAPQNVVGATEVSATVEVTGADTKPVEFRFLTEPDDDNLAVDFVALEVTGPADPGASQYAAERQACATAIVEDFAPLAFRRPLRGEERDALQGLFDAGDAESGFVVGLKMLMQGILANPSFLYLVEYGEPVDGRAGVFRLEPWELAARLSYALCEGPPDAALRAAAADGSIEDAGVLEEHARRLLADPCGRETSRRFYREWLHLDRVPELNKSPDVFPEWNDDVRDGLVAEVDAFIDGLVWDEDATIATFLSTDAAWPDPRSAFLSGVDGVTTQERVTLGDDHAGVLTQPALLAVTGDFDGTSPVHRGVFVLERVLCQELPPPPIDVDIAPPPPDPDLTTRQRWSAHSEDPSCAGCHATIDPVGFALEDFDAIGRHRTEESGQPVDAAGGVPSIGIDDGSVVGGAELAAAIAGSDVAAACFSEQWLRFALGRMAVDADDETLDALTDAAGTGSMSEVLVSIATSESFRHRYEAQP